MKRYGRNLMAKLYVVGLACTLTVAPADAGRRAGIIRNVVLVHGAFADGSGWEAVAAILKKDGYTVAVVQHPETSYAEDIRFTKAVIARQPGPVVLMGHSYGGPGLSKMLPHPRR